MSLRRWLWELPTAAADCSAYATGASTQYQVDLDRPPRAARRPRANRFFFLPHSQPHRLNYIVMVSGSYSNSAGQISFRLDLAIRGPRTAERFGAMRGAVTLTDMMAVVGAARPLGT